MDDDIVTRLRAVTSRPLGMVIDPPPHPLCQEAADEIERLRHNLNETQELLARCYRMAVGHGPDFDVFDDWEEAIAAYEREADRG